MCRLNPRVDFAFKKLFGSEENTDILQAFVNAVLPAHDQVVSLVLKNPYNLKDFASDKLSILDIRAIDTKGRHLTIEMQVTDQLHYEKRALFLWSDVYAKQLKEGQDYSDLQKTIAIHVLNFDLMDEVDYHNTYKIKNIKSEKEAFDDFQLHTIELNKFHADMAHLKTSLDRWVTFLTKAHEFSKHSIPDALRQEKEVAKAIVALDTLYLNDTERALYEGQLKWLRDERAAIEKAHYEGQLEGRIEGEELGLKKGRMETARALKAAGMPLADIQKYTQLNHDDIESL